jgi:hypothetical protein
MFGRFLALTDWALHFARQRGCREPAGPDNPRQDQRS